jgi:hypothetical protein
MSYTHTASIDCISGAIGYVSKNYGDYGYSIGLEASSMGAGIFLVRCSDGGEFRILSDRWGNASYPPQCNKGTIGCADENLCHDLCDAVTR